MNTADKITALTMLRTAVSTSLESGKPITGPLAAACAVLINALRLERHQWGNAYLCCDECGGASDLTDTETLGVLLEGYYVICDSELEYGPEPYCHRHLQLPHLRISEGWVERDAGRAIEDAVIPA